MPFLRLILELVQIELDSGSPKKRITDQFFLKLDFYYFYGSADFRKAFCALILINGSLAIIATLVATLTSYLIWLFVRSNDP